jgi:hypothetical protein
VRAHNTNAYPKRNSVAYTYRNRNSYCDNTTISDAYA